VTEPRDPSDPRDAEEARAEAARRRLRAEVFGDVLPDSTQDDRVQQPGEEKGSDEWLRRNVPPHHG
jgi:hypothetical protein